MIIGIIFYAAVLVMWGIPILFGLSFGQVALGYFVIIAAGTLTCLIEDL